MDYIVSLKADVSKLKKDIDSIGDSIGKLQAAAATFAAFFLTGSVIKSAIEFEDQLNEVAIAFKQTGITSKTATASIADFAAEIQATTRFSDNAVLTTASLIQQLARLDSQGLKKATKAALDLSTALRIDLNTAATLIGKAAEGNITAFGKLGIQIEKGKTNAETFKNTLEALARFQGSSEAATNTFGGALDQLKNNFDDVIKNIGLAITGSADLTSIVKSLSSILASLAGIIQDNSKDIQKFISAGIDALKFAFDNLYSIVALTVGIFAALKGQAIASAIAGFVEMTAFVVKFILQQGILNTVMATFNGILAASKVALIGLGIGAVVIAIGALVKWVYDLYQQFGSLNGVLSAVSLKFSKFVATVTGNTEAAANYQKQIDKLAKSAELAKEATKQVFDEQEALRKEQAKFRAQEIEAAQAAAAQRAKELQENLAREREASQKAIDQITGQVKNAGLDALDILTKDTTAAIGEVAKALNNGTINYKQAVELRAKIDLDYATKAAKLEEDRLKKEEDGRKKALEPASKAFGALTQGAAGAASAISEGIGMFANTLLPGIGSFVTQIVSFLAQGPEKVRETITAFIQAIPMVIENILLSIPVLIQTISDQLPIIIDRLVALLPTIINAIVQSLPQLAITLSLLMPKIALSFTIALIKAIPSIIEAIIIGIPTMIYEFTVGLVQAAWDFAVAIYDAIKSLIPGGGLIDQATGGGGGGGIIGAVTDFFGFAEGGMVPAGYPNDSYPAKLTSGEAVLPTDTVQRLDQFLSGQGGGGSQNVTINLVVGEEQLAKVMLNLNRQGFRTS